MIGRTTRSVALMAALCSACVAAPAAAQTSASYKLQETSVNNGGGTALASAHYRVSLDAIGDGVAPTSLSSASFHADVGFVGRYPPAGEVMGLLFTNPSSLQWNPEPSAVRYEIYRGTITSLPGTFGTCFASDLNTVTSTDASIPLAGSGFFYLVTARNRLGEEGTKGYFSNGTERTNPLPCP